MPPKETAIGKRLDAARTKLGFTQIEAAEKWGISLRALQSWEQGQREPRGLALRALEEILRKAGV